MVKNTSQMINTMPQRDNIRQVSFLKALRALLREIAESDGEFYPSEVHERAYEQKTTFRDDLFRYGWTPPYSERLENALSILLRSGELRLSTNDPRKLMISKELLEKVDQE